MTYYSQYGQDRFVREQLLSGSEGYFLEIGADDGVANSNTLVFEQAGWKGLCIEPSPARYTALRSNRSCECLNIAISSTEGPAPFLDIVGYGKGLSGLTRNYDPRHVARIAQETTGNPKTLSRSHVTVPARRLDAVLAERGITSVNFCSIDVEGSELDVLRSIDFDAVSFDVMLLEDNYDSAEIKRLMEERGFAQRAAIGQDLIYVRAGFG